MQKSTANQRPQEGIGCGCKTTLSQPLAAARYMKSNRVDIKKLIAQLIGQGLKKHTVHNILTPLKEAYNHAMDEGLITSNPVARTGRLTRSKEDRRIHVMPLTSDEVRTLLATAFEYVPSTYAMLLCAVRTGLRQGELIGLQWSDIDFRGGFIEVRRAVAMRRLSTTKSHKIRRVDMTPKLAEVLKQLKVTRELESAMAGRPVQEWVFVTPSDTRWDDMYVLEVNLTVR